MKYERITILLKFVVVLVLCAYSSSSVFGAILASADFENGNHPKWRIIGNKNGVTIKSDASPVCTGVMSAEFLLRANDAKTRVELVDGGAGNLKFGSEYWVGFAVFLPSDWKIDKSRASNDTIWNIHGSPDKNLGEKYRNAPFSLRVSGDHWVFTSRSCTSKVCDKKNIKATSINLGKWETGKWTEFILNFRLSYKNNGYIEMWKNGERVVNLSGPNTYNDTRGPYVKYGIYKSAWGKPQGAKESGFSTRKLYYDSVIVGDGDESYQSVEPNCGSAGKLKPPASLSIQ